MPRALSLTIDMSSSAVVPFKPNMAVAIPAAQSTDGMTPQELKKTQKDFGKWVGADKDRKILGSALDELTAVLMKNPHLILETLHRAKAAAAGKESDSHAPSSSSQSWDHKHVQKINHVPKTWWWQLIASLPNTGCSPVVIKQVESKDRRVISKIREFAFGVQDGFQLSPVAMDQAFFGRLIGERYRLLGCRLCGFFERCIAEDGSIDWLEHGVIQVYESEDGVIRQIRHISGAVVALARFHRRARQSAWGAVDLRMLFMSHAAKGWRQRRWQAIDRQVHLPLSVSRVAAIARLVGDCGRRRACHHGTTISFLEVL